MPIVESGEVWLIDLDPSIGREQAGKRPALVVSRSDFNKSGLELVTVVPITSKPRRYVSRVPVLPPEGGLRQPSWVIGEQVRTVSMLRLSERWGVVSPKTLTTVLGIICRQIEPDVPIG